jgi:voltage-gated potassium channel
VYSLQVAAPGLPAGLRFVIDAISWAIWALFAVDLAIRVWLSERRLRYVLTHPVDVLVVLLPALRPLRVLRVFTAGQALVTRGGRFSVLRSTQAVATAAGILILIAALSMLDAERDAPGAHITTFADALWWAATTVTTVGYGDTFPVTGTGRLVAVALMVVGISLVGVITATIAAWFLDQTSGAATAERADLAERLQRVEATPSPRFTPRFAPAAQNSQYAQPMDSPRPRPASSRTGSPGSRCSVRGPVVRPHRGEHGAGFRRGGAGRSQHRPRHRVERVDEHAAGEGRDERRGAEDRCAQRPPGRRGQRTWR